MNFSVIPQLIAVVTSSVSIGALFLLITAIPWGASFAVRYYKGRSHAITRAFFWSAGLLSLIALVGLLTLPPPAGVSPLSLWLVVYLYGFVPFWLALALMIICVLLLLPARPKDEEKDSGD